MPSAYKLLQFALAVFGAVFLLVYPLALVWPSGWTWHSGAPYQSDYFMMIVGMYATLGVFLLNAARNPQANLSLIWFTVVSSAVHAAIMAVQSFSDTTWDICRATSRRCFWWPSSCRCSCCRPASSSLLLRSWASVWSTPLKPIAGNSTRRQRQLRHACSEICTMAVVWRPDHHPGVDFGDRRRVTRHIANTRNCVI